MIPRICTLKNHEITDYKMLFIMIVIQKQDNKIDEIN